MSTIWCSISGHGFGHAAQVIHVLNCLARRKPRLKAVLTTEVPRSFFASRLHARWEIMPAQQDVGCVQHGPLQIDVPATWSAYRAFH